MKIEEETPAEQLTRTIRDEIQVEAKWSGEREGERNGRTSVVRREENIREAGENSLGRVEGGRSTPQSNPPL